MFIFEITANNVLNLNKKSLIQTVHKIKNKLIMKIIFKKKIIK